MFVLATKNGIIAINSGSNGRTAAKKSKADKVDYTINVEHCKLVYMVPYLFNSIIKLKVNQSKRFTCTTSRGEICTNDIAEKRKDLNEKWDIIVLKLQWTIT